MKKYLKLLILMGFFSIINNETVNAAAAAAASSAEDSEESWISRSFHAISDNQEFSKQVRSLMPEYLERSDIESAFSNLRGFSALIEMVPSDTQETIKTIFSILEDELKKSAEEEAASAAFLERYRLSEMAFASAGTHFDPDHPLFALISTIEKDVKEKTQAFVDSMAGCDGSDVHVFNKAKISKAKIDRLLFTTIMPSLSIESENHKDTIDHAKKVANRIYKDNPKKLENIHHVLNTIKPDTATNRDGLERRHIYKALSQVLILIEKTDEALDGSATWLQLFLDKIAENRETGGGCTPGILGRLVEIGMRAFHALTVVSLHVESLKGFCTADSSAT